MMAKHHISRKAAVIAICIAIQTALMVFLMSIGYAIVYGGSFGIRFGEDRLLLITPKEGRMKEVKQLLQKEGEVEYLFDGSWESGRSNILLFSTGGMPCVFLKQEDLHVFAESFGVTLREGAWPMKSDEVVLTQPSMRMEETQIGGWIGKDSKNYTLLRERYQVKGIIHSDKNIILGCCSKKTGQLIIALKKQHTGKTVSALKQHPELVETDRLGSSGSQFVQRIASNLQKIGAILMGLLSLQLWVTFRSLMRVYLNDKFKEIGLYWCLGFSIKKLKKRFYEMYFKLALAGGAAGAAGGLMCNVLFMYLFCEMRGIPYKIFEPFFVLIPLGAAGVISLIGALWVERLIKKADWLMILSK